ncbi:MAG: murein transglycosylase A [Alphaproteobacteria bacterium]
MTGLRLTAVVGVLLLAAACGPRPPEAERLDLAAVGFDDLPGWNDDRQAEALVALRRSCERFAAQPDDRGVGADGLAGTVADWRAPCAAAAAIADGDDAAARAFFETWFTPFRATAGRERDGFFTGYFEPLLAGARAPDRRYVTPIYALPPDLITVNLGEFRPELRGERIAGRIEAGALKPYSDRAAIDAGALDGRATTLAWVDDPVDAFFLHVQGSGRIRLDDGEMLRVGYAGSNGHAYVSIGRVLVERGALTAEEVSLDSIRAWLAANPDEAGAVLAANPSYVFFRELEEGDGPIGSQGAVLTPGRSLAVDPLHVPLGVPVWLDIMAPAPDPAAPDRRVRRLVVAQDTGGAIKGPLRGDVFWGFGREAGSIAGRMKHPGRLYLLLPRAAVARHLAAAD